MTDERNGLPSASKMERIANCPFSHKAEAVWPEVRSDEADSGTRIHAALAGALVIEGLSPDEQQTMEMCERQAKALVAEWTSGDDEQVSVLRETRLWLNEGRLILSRPKATARFSGQADLIVYESFNDRALVIDYKTGRGDQSEAVDNAQLASLAVLVAHYLGVQSIRVAIVQPWVGQPTVADYDAEALDAASRWLNDALLAEQSSTPADRKAGKWCKFCKAAQNNACEVFRDYTNAVPALIQPETVATLPKKEQEAQLLQRAMQMPAAQLAEAYSKLTLVAKAIDALKNAAKKRAESDPEFQQFYAIKEKAGSRKITDVGEAFSRAAVYEVSASEFTAICSAPIGKLEELLARATGKKGKELETIMEHILDDIVEQAAPSIELKPVKAIEA